MFHWRKEMDRLDIPAVNVRRLHRSLSDIQVALPGLPAQQSSAYLCLFTAEDGFGISVVFHLHASRKLAFYVPEQGKIPMQNVGRILDEGIHFAESMGFMLGDLDFHHLDAAEQARLWNSLPLKNGAAAEAISVNPAETARKEFVPDSEPEPEAEIYEEAEEYEAEGEGDEFDEGQTGEWEKDLGTRQETALRKRKPSAEEMEAKRQTLLENIGRFLSSL